MGASRKPAGTARKESPKAPTRARRVVVDTQELILQTAERLFARDGYEGVSNKQLASEAGLTIGALYHYFPNKDAIYAAAIRHAFASRPALPKAIRSSAESAERKLIRLTAWFVRLIMTDQSVGLLLQRELLDPRLDIEEIRHSGQFGDAVELFHELLRELLPKVHPDYAMASLAALLFGFSNLKGIRFIAPKAQDVPSTPEAIASHAVSLLLRGMSG